jgi:hypothetical protein
VDANGLNTLLIGTHRNGEGNGLILANRRLQVGDQIEVLHGEQWVPVRVNHDKGKTMSAGVSPLDGGALNLTWFRWFGRSLDDKLIIPLNEAGRARWPALSPNEGRPPHGPTQPL